MGFGHDRGVRAEFIAMYQVAVYVKCSFDRRMFNSMHTDQILDVMQWWICCAVEDLKAAYSPLSPGHKLWYDLDK